MDSVDELWASGGREGPPMGSPKKTIRDAVKQRPAEQGFLTFRAASRHVDCWSFCCVSTIMGNIVLSRADQHS
jgi:hypothetical protein